MPNILLRLTEQEHSNLKSQAHAHQTSMHKYIKDLLFPGLPVAAPPVTPLVKPFHELSYTEQMKTMRKK